MVGTRVVPTGGQLRWRAAAARLGPLLFPAHIVDPQESLAKAQQRIQDHCGLLVLMNHFSARDPLQLLCLLFGNKCLRQRHMVAPIAYHQNSPAVQYLAGWIGFELFPVVTEEAGAAGSQEPEARLLAYIRATVKTLSDGGIVILAPQVGRRACLGKPTDRPIGLLTAELRRKRISCASLLFVGLGLPGVTDYSTSSVRGLNFARSYNVRLGGVVELGEALEQAGGRRQIDAWAFSQLRKLVPAAYGGC
jgi:hypothetical protein